ncbi:hypothetical protein E2C01_051868 [Portunus trituberculatus]|uniref:Uncharacterized protein n=1 Tax=Portunus trituberculatus TaxID=210409 RepID=A0A5B7GLL7_PORTR|nr:hypothetical protein [Portunus trituberculatus]
MWFYLLDERGKRRIDDAIDDLPSLLLIVVMLLAMVEVEAEVAALVVVVARRVVSSPAPPSRRSSLAPLSLTTFPFSAVPPAPSRFVLENFKDLTNDSTEDQAK